MSFLVFRCRKDSGGSQAVVEDRKAGTLILVVGRAGFASIKLAVPHKNKEAVVACAELCQLCHESLSATASSGDDRKTIDTLFIFS